MVTVPTASSCLPTLASTELMTLCVVPLPSANSEPTASLPTISTLPSFSTAPGAKIASAPSHTISPWQAPTPAVSRTPVNVIVSVPSSIMLLTLNVPATGPPTFMVMSAVLSMPGTTPPTQFAGSNRSPGFPLPENVIVLLPATVVIPSGALVVCAILAARGYQKVTSHQCGS